MNIVRPFGRVLIRPITDIGKEAELQMIVCIDQSRKQEKPRQVKRACPKVLIIRRGLALHRVNSPPGNGKRSECRLHPLPARNALP